MFARNSHADNEVGICDKNYFAALNRTTTQNINAFGILQNSCFWCLQKLHVSFSCFVEQRINYFRTIAYKVTSACGEFESSKKPFASKLKASQFGSDHQRLVPSHSIVMRPSRNVQQKNKIIIACKSQPTGLQQFWPAVSILP